MECLLPFYRASRRKVKAGIWGNGCGRPVQLRRSEWIISFEANTFKPKSLPLNLQGYQSNSLSSNICSCALCHQGWQVLCSALKGEASFCAVLLHCPGSARCSIIRNSIRHLGKNMSFSPDSCSLFLGDEELVQEVLFDAVVTAPMEAYWTTLALNMSM